MRSWPSSFDPMSPCYLSSQNGDAGFVLELFHQSPKCYGNKKQAGGPAHTGGELILQPGPAGGTRTAI